LIEETQKIRERLEKDMSIPKFDHTWAVFDKDNFPDEHFDNAINKGEQQKRKINCAWSNEVFELWYLLHFEYISAPMSRVDFKPKIESWLSQKMGKPFQYEKNRTDMYDLLQQFGDEQQAIIRAEKPDQSYEDHRYSKQNPNTRLYLLIRQLNEMKQG
jgi:hypothetical protein